MDKKFDAVLPVASSIHASKAMYALLLGSGISRAARIKSGYEITGELINRIAKTQKADVGSDPHSWYQKTFEKQARYDGLLENLAPSADDRHMLLRPYFEPNDADKSNGDKRPTVAHQAIARLVKKGFIRVVITTNFDRLLEQALETEGVAFTVVYTDSMVLGMLPLVHGGVVLIKVNGDYTDTSLRNTENELTNYGPAMSGLLSRVFDEYGLVVCGWSAKWDKGLRDLIQQSPNRRFSSFWTTIGPPDLEQTELIRNRQGNTIEITDADSFFTSIEEKVMALESLGGHTPLTSKLAAESVKQYLPDPSKSIRLQELIEDEGRRVRDLLEEYNISNSNTGGGADELLRRIAFYEEAVGTIMQILIVGGYYGGLGQKGLWRKAFELVGSSLTRGGSTIRVRSLTLQLYPLAYLFYGFGIASLLGEREYNLMEILRRWKFEPNIGDIKTAHAINNVAFCWQNGTGLLDEWPKPSEGQKYHMPFSEFLIGRLEEPLKGVVSSPKVLAETFDQFEILLDLDSRYEGVREDVRGRYTYKIAKGYDTEFINKLKEDISRQPPSGLLAAGFFGGKPENFEKVLADLVQSIGHYRGNYW